MNIFWDTATERLLVSAWKDGLSCTQIAQELGTTRNAVAGKLTRMGINDSDRPIIVRYRNANRFRGDRA